MMPYPASISAADVKDGGFRVKILTRVEEKYMAYRLRKKIYCDELDWVAGGHDEIEVDGYDADAILLGVLDCSNAVVGTVRIVPARFPMMIEKEFARLIAPAHRIRKGRDAVEISRLGVCRSLRAGSRTRVSRLLYQAILRWCGRQGVRYLYMVVERKMLRNLNLSGFPCRQIGPLLTLTGGYDTVAALLDRHLLGRRLPVRRPAPLAHWHLTQDASTHSLQA